MIMMIKEIKTGRRGTRPRRAADTSGTRPRRRRTPRRLAPAASTAPTAFPTTGFAMHHTATSRSLFIASPGRARKSARVNLQRPVSGPGRFWSLPRRFKPCLLCRLSFGLSGAKSTTADVSSTACWLARSRKKNSKPAACDGDWRRRRTLHGSQIEVTGSYHTLGASSN